MLAAVECATGFVALAPRDELWARRACACARALPAGRGLVHSTRQLERHTKTWAKRLRMQRPVTDALKEVKAAPVVAVGDAVALLTFAAIGRGNHGSEDGSVLLTAFPFLLAWFLCAPVLGAYRSAPSLQQAVTTALPAWALSVPLGCLVRGLFQDRVSGVCACVRLRSACVCAHSARA